MFESTTWSKCFSEWWFGDGLPNDTNRPRKITFEQLFASLLHREELEYHLQEDTAPFRARSKSRFDTPEHVCVFGDTLRRLALFKGTRAAVKRKGFQKDVRLIANATSAQCFQVLTHDALGTANTEALARDVRVSKELATALRQVLISTKDVPLTDGYKRNLRHEGHNLNVMFGSLIVFVTFNFADTYAPLLFKLCSGEDVIGDIVCDLSAEQPDMPSLHRMHQLIAESPRAQVVMGITLLARVYSTNLRCGMGGLVRKLCGWQDGGRVDWLYHSSSDFLVHPLIHPNLVPKVLPMVRFSSSSSWMTSPTSTSWESTVPSLVVTTFPLSLTMVFKKIPFLPLAYLALEASA
jgi:hypothetical protein